LVEGQVAPDTSYEEALGSLARPLVGPAGVVEKFPILLSFCCCKSWQKEDADLDAIIAFCLQRLRTQKKISGIFLVSGPLENSDLLWVLWQLEKQL
jgi:hypothetical protein